MAEKTVVPGKVNRVLRETMLTHGYVTLSYAAQKLETSVSQLIAWGIKTHPQTVIVGGHRFIPLALVEHAARMLAERPTPADYAAELASEQTAHQAAWEAERARAEYAVAFMPGIDHEG